MGMLAAVHSNQFVMAACIWSKDITISDEGLCLYPGSELKLQKKRKRGGLKCSKCWALLLQCARKAGLCVDFMCHMMM